jgi:hypothetical protein
MIDGRAAGIDAGHARRQRDERLDLLRGRVVDGKFGAHHEDI